MKNIRVHTNTELSRYADGLLCILYKKYKVRIKGMNSESKARKFLFSEFYAFAAKYIPGEILDVFNELKCHDMVEFTSYDNAVYFIHLQDEAVEYMDYRCMQGKFNLSKHISKMFFEL